MITHSANVAGTFYPGDPICLKDEINHLLANAKVQTLPANSNIKALIVPHAGYIYSGAVAASAYACLQDLKHNFHRVVMFGPSHHYPVKQLTSHSADYFATPLGKIKIDHSLLTQLNNTFEIEIIDRVFEGEHCLEVQLPFLQAILKNFTLLPILTGASTLTASSNFVSRIIELLWEEKDILFIISTDLSHFLCYDEAKKLDATTIEKTLNLKYDTLDFDNACGLVPLTGIIKASIKRYGDITLLDACNSGDTAGDRNRVVGYASFIVHQGIYNKTQSVILDD